LQFADSDGNWEFSRSGSSEAEIVTSVSRCSQDAALLIYARISKYLLLHVEVLLEIISAGIIPDNSKWQVPEGVVPHTNSESPQVAGVMKFI
jgi:hypothetical protein